MMGEMFTMVHECLSGQVRSNVHCWPEATLFLSHEWFNRKFEAVCDPAKKKFPPQSVTGRAGSRSG